MSTKRLRRLVAAGKIGYYMDGARRKFDEQDLQAYQEARRKETPCQPTSPRGGNTTRSRSKSKVYDFVAERAKRRSA